MGNNSGLENTEEPHPKALKAPESTKTLENEFQHDISSLLHDRQKFNQCFNKLEDKAKDISHDFGNLTITGLDRPVSGKDSKVPVPDSVKEAVSQLTPQEIAKARASDKQNPHDHYNEDSTRNQYFKGIQNSREVIPGTLYRGANPGGSDDAKAPWSPESLMQGLQTLKDKGITTVVDFESGSGDPFVAAKINAERAGCAALGINFVSIPMSHDGPTQAQETQFEDIVKQAKQNGGEVYCHCREGRDRTGFMVGLIRENLNGWSVAQAKAEDVADGYNAYKQKLYPALNLSGERSANA